MRITVDVEKLLNTERDTRIRIKKRAEQSRERAAWRRRIRKSVFENAMNQVAQSYNWITSIRDEITWVSYVDTLRMYVAVPVWRNHKRMTRLKKLITTHLLNAGIVADVTQPIGRKMGSTSSEDGRIHWPEALLHITIHQPRSTDSNTVFNTLKSLGYDSAISRIDNALDALFHPSHGESAAHRAHQFYTGTLLIPGKYESEQYESTTYLSHRGLPEKHAIDEAPRAVSVTAMYATKPFRDHPEFGTHEGTCFHEEDRWSRRTIVKRGLRWCRDLGARDWVADKGGRKHILLRPDTVWKSVFRNYNEHADAFLTAQESWVCLATTFSATRYINSCRTWIQNHIGEHAWSVVFASLADSYVDVHDWRRSDRIVTYTRRTGDDCGTHVYKRGGRPQSVEACGGSVPLRDPHVGRSSIAFKTFLHHRWWCVPMGQTARRRRAMVVLQWGTSCWVCPATTHPVTAYLCG